MPYLLIFLLEGEVTQFFYAPIKKNWYFYEPMLLVYHFFLKIQSALKIFRYSWLTALLCFMFRTDYHKNLFIRYILNAIGN
jgi:hypothetical protein